MAFIPSTDVLRVVVQGVAALRSVINVLHFKEATAPGASDPAQLAQDFYDSWEARVLPFLSSAYALVSVTASDLTTADGATATVSEAVRPVGGQTGEVLPPGASAVLTLRTAARGRTARGRIYLGPLPESRVSAGVMDPVLSAGLESGLTQLQADMAGQGWNLGVLSQYVDGAPRAEGLFRPVTDIVLRTSVVGYQERRTGRS